MPSQLQTGLGIQCLRERRWPLQLSHSNILRRYGVSGCQFAYWLVKERLEPVLSQFDFWALLQLKVG